MTEKRILVTGASRGIGRATALALLEAGHSVILHAVEQMCRRIEDDGKGLDVLVNNAALVTHELRYSTQGIELQWAVNHLAGFYLANRLLPLLAAPKAKETIGSDGGGTATGTIAVGRVVQVSSIAHGFIKDVDFSVNEVGRDATRGTHPYDHRYHYYRSKLANVLFVTEWARRNSASMVTANALHPGIVQTRLSRAYMRNPVFRFFESLIATSADRAATTSVHLAADESVSGISGSFFKGCRQVSITGLGGDQELGERLWETSLDCIPAELRDKLSRSVPETWRKT